MVSKIHISCFITVIIFTIFHPAQTFAGVIGIRNPFQNPACQLAGNPDPVVCPGDYSAVTDINTTILYSPTLLYIITVFDVFSFMFMILIWRNPRGFQDFVFQVQDLILCGYTRRRVSRRHTYRERVSIEVIEGTDQRQAALDRQADLMRLLRDVGMI